MKLKFLGQGLSSEIDYTLGEVLIQSLECGDYNKAIWITAFSRGNVFEEFRTRIAEFCANGSMTIITGIDQGGTSYEALAKLVSLQVNSFVFHSSSPPIFHPKCYIFQGESRYRIVIGSSNLTRNGLFNNIENSIQVDFEDDDVEGVQFYDSIKLYYKDIFSEDSPNLQKLTVESIKEIEQLNLLPDTDKAARPEESVRKDPTVIEKIRALFPALKRRMFRGLKPDKPAKARASEPYPETAQDISGAVNDNELILWSKVNLPASDVEFTREGTNPTGRLKLVKAGHDIDQTIYFRNEVFDSLSWQPRADSEKEDASAIFRISIDGVIKGDFRLNIMHNPKGDAGQNNYTTSISWKNVSEIIRKQDLRGKRLLLSKSSEPSYQFMISIA